MVRLSLALLVGLPHLVAAQQVAPRAPAAWTAATIPWSETYPDGTKYALLEGRRDVTGEAFTYAFYIPKGYWEHHWHSADARVAVLQGVLKLAYGSTLDSVHTTSFGVGSFALVPANRQHTMGADEPTVIIGTAVGPWATHRHEH
jgi:quercetin dioxygenase-like cupin family protein